MLTCIAARLDTRDSSLMLSAVQATPVRIVAVSSDVHSSKGFDVQDLNFRRRPYSRSTPYHQSKLCNILFIKELANRYAFDLCLFTAASRLCTPLLVAVRLTGCC